MQKADVQEAAPIMVRGLRALLAVVPPAQMLASFTLRMSCNRMIANAEPLIQADQAGPGLQYCFDVAILAGATQPQIASVRQKTLLEAPKSLGAIMVRDAIVRFCLATEAQIIADMTFTSRSDVEALLGGMNAAFADVEEAAADAMDQMTYQAMVKLHAALVHHLVQTAQPLPRMIGYTFASPLPSLTMAQRLYYDASRADELIAENKTVHPAFCPMQGRALSF
jgi:hypothetical protein